ncbi:cytochrome b561 [Candidatus Thiomargarita nelsonii]|uniref:Cytochrome b561 n=1 Tax=Candidatus Thiomargarita nelsonii TaxID=1003181 RepID=A0A0A6P1I0_9GAMM|nr:cytochrome b561 [Candidatus Thiomargarita nelsonii]
MSVAKYHASIRAIHWIMFVLFAIMFVLGVVMVEFKESEPWAMYNFHKATGVLLFLLVWLRLILRWKSQVPPPSADIKPLEHRIAQSVVHLLYLFMIIVPITGYALSNIHGYDVKFYGLPLPKLFPTLENGENISRLVHEYLAYTFLGVISLHLLGVIKHHVKGQEVLRRMT